MVNNHISNLISKFNNGDFNFFIDFNKSIVNIIQDLELKGYISYEYNPYTKKFYISNNRIEKIVMISKPSRKIYFNKDKEPYKLTIGTFLTKKVNNQLFELILYVQ